MVRRGAAHAAPSSAVFGWKCFCKFKAAKRTHLVDATRRQRRRRTWPRAFQLIKAVRSPRRCLWGRFWFGVFVVQGGNEAASEWTPRGAHAEIQILQTKNEDSQRWCGHRWENISTGKTGKLKKGQPPPHLSMRKSVSTQLEVQLMLNAETDGVTVTFFWGVAVESSL